MAAGDNCVCIQRRRARAPQLHDNARLFQGCGVVEPAVLSIDCYFESPADGTAVSLRDGAFGNLRLRRGAAEGGAHRGILDMLLPLYMISFRGSDSSVAITLRTLARRLTY